MKNSKTGIELLLDSFIVHRKCEEEIADFLQNRPNDIRFLTAFLTRLEQLKEKGVKATDFGRKAFEPLKGTGGLFSMHINTNEVNYRVIYSFVDKKSILLCGFFERERKKSTDYSGQIPKAQQRFKEWRQQHEIY